MVVKLMALLCLLPRCTARYAYAFHATSEPHLAAVMVNARRLQQWAPASMDIDYVAIVPSAARFELPPLLKGLLYSQLPGPPGYYRESMAKLLIFKMVQYERVVYLDADALVLRSLHQFFELPSAPLASALAYWENENCFTGALLVAKPDEAMYGDMMRRVPDIVRQGRTEMDLLNRFFEHRLGRHSKTFPRVLMLPGTTLVLSSHFYDRKHAYRPDMSFGASMFSDLDALAADAAIIHFSGDAKPWQRSRPYWEQKARRAVSSHYLRFVYEFLDEYQDALSPLTITVCVPAISEDVATLDAVLRSVDAQTQQPDEIVVYITGVDSSPVGTARAPLRILSERGLQRTSGYSRNRCMEQASSAFVMFIDADDQLHPNRVRIVRGYLQSGHTLVLHGHSDFHAAEHLDPRTVAHSELVHSASTTSPRTPLLPDSTSGVTHGHPIVKTSLGIKIKYDEGFHGGEDADFLHRVLLSGNARAIFLLAKLTIVTPRGAAPPMAKHVCRDSGSPVVITPAKQRPRGPWACRIIPHDTSMSLCATADAPNALSCAYLALF
jgi:hypothetical protein